MSEKIKKSIRFFNNHEVRAVWDEQNSKWWFSVLDIVGAINNQSDYTRSRNYWKYLKSKLRKQDSEVVSVTNQLKLRAADGKLYLTDVRCQILQPNIRTIDIYNVICEKPE